MGEEVKIKVSSEADSSGVEKMRKEIEKLHEEAEKIDKRNADPKFGMGKRKEALDKQKLVESTVRASGETGIADSIKAENDAMEIALRLQQRHNMGYAEAIKLGRQEVANKIRIKQEAAAVQGMANGRAKQELITAARLTAEGQSPMRSLGSALGQMIPQIASRIGLAGAAAVGLVGVAVGGLLAYANSYINERRRDETISIQHQAERSSDKREMRDIQSWRGTSSDAVNKAFAYKEDENKRIDQRKMLEDNTKLAWYNPLGWANWGGRDFRKVNLFGAKTEGQRAIEENEEQIGRDKQKSSESDALAKRKFANEEGGLELEMARGTAKHNIGGMKERLVAERALTWLTRYREVMAQVHDDGIANEAAMLKVEEDQRQMQLRAASGLVNARSGAGDIAQAATIASAATPEWGRVVERLDLIHNEQKKAGDAITRKDNR